MADPERALGECERHRPDARAARAIGASAALDRDAGRRRRRGRRSQRWTRDRRLRHYQRYANRMTATQLGEFSRSMRRLWGIDEHGELV